MGSKETKLYGVEISTEMVSKITERILPKIKEWQNRPLDIESLSPYQKSNETFNFSNVF